MRAKYRANLTFFVKDLAEPQRAEQDASRVS